MTIKPIIIVSGEPYSIFLEIFFKSFKKKKIQKLKNPIIIICSKNLLLSQMNKLKYKFNFKNISKNQFNLKGLNNKKINIIDVDFKFKKPFDRISFNSKGYIEQCMNIALNLIKKNKIKALINGPISKTHFLKKKFPGITEYIGFKTKSKNQVMLIYNKNLAVTPLTTHIPIKDVARNIKKNTTNMVLAGAFLKVFK